MPDPDRTLRRAVAGLAAGVAGLAAGGAGSLRDRMIPALDRAAGRMSVAVSDDAVRLPGWSRPARVDIAVRGRLAGGQSLVAVCRRWPDAGAPAADLADVLAAAAVDASGTAAFLVAEAPDAVWSAGGLPGLLAAGGEVAVATLPGGADAAGSLPGPVPARLGLRSIAAVRVAGAGDETRLIRAARVAAAGGTLMPEAAGG